MMITETEPTTTAADDSPDGHDRADGPVDRVRQSASDAYETARQRTTALYGSARERATIALETTRDGAARAGRRTAEGVDANPIAALVGGLAIGAAVAALLPRSSREDAALGKIGGQIRDGARQAADAARSAGQEKLDELGLNSGGAREKLNALVKGAGDTFRRSAAAAAGSARSDRG